MGRAQYELHKLGAFELRNSAVVILKDQAFKLPCMTADVQNVRLVTKQKLRYVRNPQTGMLDALKRISMSGRLNGAVDPSNFVSRTSVHRVDGIRSEQQQNALFNHGVVCRAMSSPQLISAGNHQKLALDVSDRYKSGTIVDSSPIGTSRLPAT